MASFKEHEQGNYTVKLVELIEDFEPDQYGNRWYNVLFEGDAETFMWLAKNPPEEDKQYWGHIEPTKSGKRMRFRTDPKPEDAPRAPQSPSKAGSDKAYLRDASTIPLDCWRTLIGIQGVPEDPGQFHGFFKTVRAHAEELLSMIDHIRSGAAEQSEGAIKRPPRLKEESPPAASLGARFRQVTGEHDYGEPDGQ